MAEIKAAVIVPVYHPDSRLADLLAALSRQTRQDFEVMVLDSGSDGSYRETLEAMGGFWAPVGRDYFDHAATRRMGTEVFAGTEFFVFFTQDAVPADENALAELLAAFDDPRVGCAYGRQLPVPGAGPFGRHARLINYGAESHVYSLEDRQRHGLKTAFMSDSFGAYRASALAAAGGFPRRAVMGEDMYAAARLLLAGWRVAYRASARVFHSHDYSLRQEFKRSFDIGAFQAREGWIREQFGAAEGAGLRFVRDEAGFLLREAPWRLPEMVLRDGMKFLGYRLGLAERHFHPLIKQHLGMNRGFWEQDTKER
ncbi:MAG: glycosyltransferase [Schwartzia sp.]|nr:glycosyltransferase [Schwartzia sp. (in: firmicutes)]